MTSPASPALAALLDDFSVLDDWEDRYRHIIEIGRALPEMPEALKTPATKVNGCASQVWIHATARDTADGRVLDLVGDSDALIVKGLIAVVFAMFNGAKVEDIASLDALAVFDSLGLKEHLTPQRSNGLASMVGRIKQDARSAM